MKGSAKRKCVCCGEFYRPDQRNVRHQRYCSEPACRKESKAQSQRQWQQKPENQNYFRSPENSQRVKEWRKRNPGYRRKKKSSVQGVLQEVFQSHLQAGLIAYKAPLYQVLSLEPILTSSEQPAPRTGQTLPLSAILRQMLESGKRPQP